MLITTKLPLSGFIKKTDNAAKACIARLPTDVIRLNLSNESKWDMLIMHGFLRIGSECHAVDVWDAFSDEQVAKIDKRLLPFWAANKQKIMAVANAINSI